MIAIWVVAFLISLFVFPEFMPAAFCFWMAVFSVRTYKRKSAWMFLLMVPILVAIKWPEFNWAVRILCAVCLFVALDHRLDESVSKKDTLGKAHYTHLVVLWICWAFYFASFYFGASASNVAKIESNSASVANAITNTNANASGPVVCLGDSLTDYGYPDELRKLISLPIEDYGFDGYSSKDAVKLIPEIANLKPRIVVLEIGGHDYNNGYARAETRERMMKLIGSFKSVGANVILVEITRGFINDPYRGLERELARGFDLQLVPDTMIRRLVFWSPIVPPGMFVDEKMHNSNDGLHPNDNGNRMMAAYVADAIEKVAGPQCRVAE